MASLKKAITESDALKNESGGQAQLRAQDLSVLGHDLRAHLSPIKICAEMLQSHIPGTLNSKQDRMVATIYVC